MFVGGLNWDTTDGELSLIFFFEQPLTYVARIDGLKEYFSEFGKVRTSRSTSGFVLLILLSGRRMHHHA